MDAIALLADTWNDDLDPEVSAQLVQASAQAYLSFGKDKGKGKVKPKGKGKGRYPVRPSHLSLEDRRRRLKELKAKTESRACGRKRHWANDRECAMSSCSSSSQSQTRTARMATRQHLTNQANQAGVCFVLNEYSGDPDTSAYVVEKKSTSADRSDRTDTLHSDSFRRRLHREHSHFQRSRHGRQRRTMGDRSRSQDRLEQNVQERNVSWFAVWNCVARLSETSCITGQSKERSPQTCVSFSLGRKRIIALT